MPEATPERDTLGEGTLISHLLELRQRLLYAVVAIIVCAIGCMAFANPLFELVATPLIKNLPEGGQLISTSVAAPMFAPFKLALYSGAFLAMPVVLYQLWAFVAPGLYRHEKRFALPLVVSSILLFYAGVVFAYVVIFPLLFAVLTHAAPAGVKIMTDISEYLDFVLVMFLAIGLAFEIPVAIVLLVSTGLVRIETLRSNRGYVLLGMCVQAAVITPDVVSLAIIAAPMYALYEIGMLMALVLARRKIAEKRAEALAEAAADRPPAD